MKILDLGKAFDTRNRGSLRWTFLLISSTGLAAAFMFLVHVFAVRNLTTTAYGEFASAIALVGIVGVGASSVQASTVRRVKEQELQTALLLPRKTEYGLLIGISTLLALFSYVVVGVDWTTAALLALWVPAAIMIARANGEIQGLELQSILHGATAAITFLTLVASVFFVLLNSSVESLLIARLLVTLLCATVLLRYVGVEVKHSLLFVSAKLVHATILVTSMWFAANLDVLLSRRALSEEANGEIAVAAMLVNSVLLIPGLVAAVVYPRAIEYRENRNKSYKLLIQSIVLSGVVQLLIAGLLWITSDFLIGWLAGADNQSAKSLVFPLALAYVPLGMSIVISQSVLAIGTLKQSALFLLLVLSVSVGLLQVSSSALNFINALNLGAWVLTGFLLITSVYNISRLENEIKNV